MASLFSLKLPGNTRKYRVINEIYTLHFFQLLMKLEISGFELEIYLSRNTKKWIGPGHKSWWTTFTIINIISTQKSIRFECILKTGLIVHFHKTLFGIRLHICQRLDRACIEQLILKYKYNRLGKLALHRVLIVTPAVYPHWDNFYREIYFLLQNSTHLT